MIASQNGEIDVVKHVIDLGEDLDVQDKHHHGTNVCMP